MLQQELVELKIAELLRITDSIKPIFYTLNVVQDSIDALMYIHNPNIELISVLKAMKDVVSAANWKMREVESDFADEYNSEKMLLEAKRFINP